MSTKAKKIQNAMSHMMTSVTGSNSKLHKRSAKTEKIEERDVGSSRSKVQRKNLKVEKTEECEEDDFDPTLLPLPTNSTKAATQRIYKELKMIIHIQDTPSNDLGIYVKLDKLRSVYQWVCILV
jgi:ribosomal protein L20A (L18A)